MRLLAALVMVLLACPYAHAEGSKYPSAPIKLIIPYAPGGSGDILGRVLAAELHKRLRQPVIVENRPGGSEKIATEALAQSNPDGYTLGLLSNALSINEASAQNKTYDIARDLVPVAKVIDIPFVLLVTPKLHVNSVSELVALAKAQPGKLNYAHLGPRTPHYVTMEWFKRASGIKVVGVPYRSSAQSLTALMADQVQVMMSGLGPTLPFIKDGRVTALASMTTKRLSILPSIPTIAEAGYPKFNLLSWMGVFARAGTPANRLRLLSNEIVHIAESAEVREKLLKLGLEPSTLSVDKFGSFLQKDIHNWSSMTKDTLAKK